MVVPPRTGTGACPYGLLPGRVEPSFINRVQPPNPPSQGGFFNNPHRGGADEAGPYEWRLLRRPGGAEVHHRALPPAGRSSWFSPRFPCGMSPVMRSADSRSESRARRAAVFPAPARAFARNCRPRGFGGFRYDGEAARRVRRTRISVNFDKFTGFFDKFPKIFEGKCGQLRGIRGGANPPPGRHREDTTAREAPAGRQMRAIAGRCGEEMREKHASAPLPSGRRGRARARLRRL